ncbi:MAG: hypothetical protein JW895_13115 [Thermoleophilaceae bacterium]|nr:hypothetical protein [Thermoleophilaceae bacterium]
MFHVTLICSDEDCAVEVEAWGELADVELLVCEGCGCTLQVLSVSEAAPATAALMRLPRRAQAPTRRAA